MKILIVLTSHDTLGATGRKTGFWLEEFAAPYYAFLDAGAELTLASPRAASRRWIPRATTPRPRPRPPIVSVAMPRPSAGSRPRCRWPRRRRPIMMPCSPGGHGPLWDLAEDPRSVKLIQNMLAAGKPWRRCAMRRACCATPDRRRQADGAGQAGHGLFQRRGGRSGPEPDRAVPVEDELVRLGAQYSRAEDWQPHVIADGLLITGQNPASSVGVAEALLERLRQ